jgi:hypothetical protein
MLRRWRCTSQVLIATMKHARSFVEVMLRKWMPLIGTSARVSTHLVAAPP